MHSKLPSRFRNNFLRFLAANMLLCYTSIAGFQSAKIISCMWNKQQPTKRTWWRVKKKKNSRKKDELCVGFPNKVGRHTVDFHAFHPIEHTSYCFMSNAISSIVVMLMCSLIWCNVIQFGDLTLAARKMIVVQLPNQ